MATLERLGDIQIPRMLFKKNKGGVKDTHIWIRKLISAHVAATTLKKDINIPALTA